MTQKKGWLALMTIEIHDDTAETHDSAETIEHRGLSPLPSEGGDMGTDRRRSIGGFWLTFSFLPDKLSTRADL